MSLSARRLWGVCFLTVTMACPAMMVWPPARAATGSPNPQAHAASKPLQHSPLRHRGRRRAPPGGVWARNAVLIDQTTNEILYEKNAGSSVPIASLSKLMTVLILLEQHPDLDRPVEVTRTEMAGAGRTQLRHRERVALRDLLHMSLMCSDNAATRVLVRESGLSAEDFLARMNRKAVELGLARTSFVEFTGLDERNVSTATDCARLLRAAAEHPTVQDIMTTRSYEFRSATRRHMVANTNRLLYGRYEVLGGKTGFIGEAGYCLATWIHTQGRDLIAVVLGAPTNATRFADTVRMLQKVQQPAATNSQL